MSFVKKIAKQVLRKHSTTDAYFLPNDTRKKEIYRSVSDTTMIGVLGVLANLDAIDYLSNNNIQGSIIECGVWKGGSVAAMLMRLQDNNITDKDVYLFDTYAGMTKPDDIDKKRGFSALDKYKETQKGNINEWCFSPLEEVQSNIAKTGYPAENIHYIKGNVCQTLHQQEWPDIALLRLDTDWYESTKMEMEVLYPKVTKGGVVIIDDYGGWDGARKAVDEFFDKEKKKPLLFRVDNSRRMFIKL